MFPSFTPDESKNEENPDEDEPMNKTVDSEEKDDENLANRKKNKKKKN